MKSKLLFLSMIIFAGAFSVNAQGGYQQRTVEERVKTAMEKIEVFKLDEGKKKEVDSILTVSYKALDDKRKEIRNNSEGGDQRTAMRAEMQKISDARDEQLKKIFSEEQYKKWKDEIEPSLRPQRGAGQGRNN
jgi:hypothetical protein